MLPAVGTGSGPVGSPLSPGEEGCRPPPSSVASPSRQMMRSSEGRRKNRHGGGKWRPTAAMSTYRTATEPNHQRCDSVMVPSEQNRQRRPGSKSVYYQQTHHSVTSAQNQRGNPLLCPAKIYWVSSSQADITAYEGDLCYSQRTVISTLNVRKNIQSTTSSSSLIFG